MILTLTQAAERLAVHGGDMTRATLRRLRSLEQASGRSIVVASGIGRGRRYVVVAAELEAALDGEPEPVDVDDYAAKIAAAVQRIEERISDLSVRVFALETASKRK